MKNLKFFLFLLLLAGMDVAAETTGLFTYNGGYFVKAGDYWTEYRPAEKDGVWATYTQYNEETNYYQVKNSSCSLSIPKTSNNNFYIWEDGEWKVIYTTKHIYGYFNDESREIYAYNQGGYFVRDGNTWREYRPDKKSGTWATYTQYKEDGNFFYMRSSVSEVCVPKAENNDFYLLRDGKWSKCYTTSAIYDPYGIYDYVFDFAYYRVADEEGILHDYKSPAKLCFSRKGDGLIVCGHGNYKFRFESILSTVYKGTDTISGFKICPDADNEDQYIFVLPEWCLVNIENICDYMNLNEGSYQQEFDEIVKLIQDGIFFKD